MTRSNEIPTDISGSPTAAVHPSKQVEPGRTSGQVSATRHPTSIRNATHDDIPRIVEMAGRFYETTAYAEQVPMAKESAAGLAILTMESGVMLVVECDKAVVGMACLFVDRFTFNINRTVAHELAYWIEPEHRGGMLAARILKAIEAACLERGVDWIHMAHLPTSPEMTGQLYERFGYTCSGTNYMKVIS